MRTRSRTTVRALFLLFRDALGRFLRLRCPAPARPARPRRRRAPAPVPAVQLALF